MSRQYYVVGIMDTRSEFEFRGATTNKKKADSWLKEQKEIRRTWNSRQWPEIVTVESL